MLLKELTMNKGTIRLRNLGITLGLSWALAASALAAQKEAVPIKWLDVNAPSVPAGVSWGVPWPKGAVAKDQRFALTAADGGSLPLQTWPLAYWPDGSLKWSGFATVAGPNTAGPFKLAMGVTASATERAIVVKDGAQAIDVNTGWLQCRIPKQGASLVESMSVEGRQVACNGRLVCILQNGAQVDSNGVPPLESFTSTIKKVTVEQSGPVRAVVKFEGMHKSQKGGREWLPFSVRLYFYAGQTPVRMVHSIVFDGDEHKDFIRGLGIIFDVPMHEQIQNRHVRFAGEGDGLWAEPIQPLIGRANLMGGPGGRDVYRDQIEGRRVPNKENLNANGQHLLASWAVWDDFRLIQPNADGFTIEKRTNPESCWLAAGSGKRASGLVFAGDVSGGLAVGVKNFWQSYPVSLEVRHATKAAAELRVWLWSPDAPAMDLRHYDTVAHGLNEVYEDVQEGFSTPNGVGRTSELTLFPTAAVPTKQDTVKYAQMAACPAVLVCTPQYLHAAKAFGIWSIEDRSTPFKKAVEERLDTTLAVYLKAPEQAKWYGFWDYGDVMHSYDDTRHVWRYDLGGMAWDNTELGTDMWLWYSFLRSGRADLFRMAEAMTRHTSEVDCYHQGKFAGLGSRHNVRHWGCGAKEVRISEAFYRQFYYYLTTDERTGDVMREMTVLAPDRIAEFDPMRLAQPITEPEKKYPARLRLGPDWFALAGNWMIEWERTGDTAWRDKIYAGMDSVCAMPMGLRTGRNLVMGFDPKTSKLYPLSEEAGSYNLAIIQGGVEVVYELNMMVDHEGWQKAWLQYCRLFSAPKNVILQDMTTGTEGADGSFSRDARMAAYAYYKTKNEAFAPAGVSGLTRGGRGMGMGMGRMGGRIEGPAALNPIDESPLMNTNTAAQTGLTTIELLEMVGDRLPAEMPPQSESFGPPRGAGRGRGQPGRTPGGGDN
jgi:hypothetical protein